MNCDQVRIGISVLLDGEPAERADEIEEHLLGCAECRVWRERAHELTRRVRLGAAEPVTVPAGLGAGATATRSRRRPVPLGVVSALRLAIAVVALGQLCIALPGLLFGEDHGSPMHVAHETGAFTAAIAAGLLVAVWRPSRALGMRSLVGAAASLLVLTGVIDLVMGRTTAGDEAPHLLTVAGWLLLRQLSLLAPPSRSDRAFSLPGLIVNRIGRSSPLRGLAGDPASETDAARQHTHRAA